jgi:hypothetical protein
MPGENGLWRHDGRDLGKQLATEKDALGCEAAAIVICQTQAPPTKLLFE